MPTPSPPPPELLDLPKQAWTKRLLTARTPPIATPANNSSQWSIGEELGYFPYGTAVTIERYEWSAPAQAYWIYLKQNNLAGWVAYKESVVFDGPPQAEVTLQAFNDLLPVPRQSLLLDTQDLDGRLLHDLGAACYRVLIYGTNRPIVSIVQELRTESLQVGWYLTDEINGLTEHYIQLSKAGIGRVLLYSLRDPLPNFFLPITAIPLEGNAYATVYVIGIDYFGPVSGCGWQE